VPKLKRDDGIELQWDERGEGALVILAPYWSGHPSAYDPLAGDLARDRRVVRYDARGTGQSTRSGPHDMDTGAADLGAVAEMAGGDAVVVALADSCPWASRVAADRPELVRAVVAPGSAPIPLSLLRESDSLLSSETVVEAFIEMMGTDYRGALRTLLTSTNPQMSEEEVRERVAAQADFCPSETAVGRTRAWVTDDSSEQGRAIGERLTILFSDEMGGAWLPRGEELAGVLGEHLPDAQLVPIADGIASRPDLTAEVIRDLESP
jgi:pimeloyl-ACP methyl ester carboxylesterase